MIRKKNSIVIQQSRSITSFFNRNLEIFERPFDGTPAAIDAPSRVFAVEQATGEVDPLDISGYLTNNVPPCPDSGPCGDCAENGGIVISQPTCNFDYTYDGPSDPPGDTPPGLIQDAQASGVIAHLPPYDVASGSGSGGGQSASLLIPMQSVLNGLTDRVVWSGVLTPNILPLEDSPSASASWNTSVSITATGTGQQLLNIDYQDDGTYLVQAFDGSGSDSYSFPEDDPIVFEVRWDPAENDPDRLTFTINNIDVGYTLTANPPSGISVSVAIQTFRGAEPFTVPEIIFNGTFGCGGRDLPLFASGDGWTVDDSVNPDSMNFLSFGSGVTFAADSLGDSASIYVPFSTGVFPWSYTARVLIQGTDPGNGGSGLHITTGVGLVAPPGSGSNNRRSIEINPRRSAGAGDIPIGTMFLQVSSVNDAPSSNDQTANAVTGSIGVGHDYEFFIKAEFNGSSSGQTGYKAWLAGQPEPVTYLRTASGGVTGNRYFFLRFDGGNFPGTVTVNHAIVPGLIFEDEHAPCPCSGESAVSTLLYDNGSWGTHDAISVDYYTEVWFDGLRAVNGTDYNVVNKSIVPTYPLDSNAIIKARYVIL